MMPNQYSWPACRVNENGLDCTQSRLLEGVTLFNCVENSRFELVASQIMKFRSPPLGISRKNAIDVIVVVVPTITPCPGPESALRDVTPFVGLKSKIKVSARALPIRQRATTATIPTDFIARLHFIGTPHVHWSASACAFRPPTNSSLKTLTFHDCELQSIA